MLAGCSLFFNKCLTFFHRGLSTSQGAPFKTWYGQVGELRVRLHASVKIAVFTATASKSTMASVFGLLYLKPISTYCIERSPLKENL